MGGLYKTFRVVKDWTDPQNYHICVPFNKREDACHPCKQKSLWVFQKFTIAFLRVYSIICSFFWGEPRASTSTVPVPTTSKPADVTFATEKRTCRYLLHFEAVDYSTTVWVNGVSHTKEELMLNNLPIGINVAMVY